SRREERPEGLVQPGGTVGGKRRSLEPRLGPPRAVEPDERGEGVRLAPQDGAGGKRVHVHLDEPPAGEDRAIALAGERGVQGTAGLAPRRSELDEEPRSRARRLLRERAQLRAEPMRIDAHPADEGRARRDGLLPAGSSGRELLDQRRWAGVALARGAGCRERE